MVAPAATHVPVGLELYSVRDELAKDLMGTVRAVAKMGYEVVEFFSPYFTWTPDYAKEVRKLLDDLGIRCNSTHNGSTSFTPDGLQKAIELNQIIGSKIIVLASAGKVTGLDGWKTVADQLTGAAEKLKPLGMRTGYHNHKLEFVPLEGKRLRIRWFGAKDSHGKAFSTHVGDEVLVDHGQANQTNNYLDS